MRSRPWVLITGATGGIGSAAGHSLARSGFDIVGIDRHRPVDASSFRHFITADLAMYSEVSTALDGLVASFGAPFSVVLAAGIYHRRPLLDYNMIEAESVLRTNFLAALHVVREILPHLLRAKTGRFIFISSQAGVTGGTDAVYAASKGALTSLMKSVAREHAASGIRANAISPGPIDTPMARVMGSHRQRQYEALGNVTK